MGRANVIPADYAGERMRLRRIPMVDGGAYDQGGAYWGISSAGNHVYCAWGSTETATLAVYVWAKHRRAAKRAVRTVLASVVFLT